MRPNQSYPPRNRRPAPSKNGFALIATISVMVLLVMIALAMLSLSSIELRSSQRGEAMETARANARIALMIAIGELQKTVGPDQRVTAEADILDSTGFSGWSRDDNRKHYVGVYSTEDWHKKDSSGKPPAWETYDQNRNKDAFLRWLVSGTDQQVNALDFVQTQASDPVVELVGKGTLGDHADDSENVSAPLVNITNSQQQITGKYAWWAGDEGIKAKINLTDNRDFTAEAKPNQRRYEAMNPATVGSEAITDFDSLDRNSISSEDFTKVLAPRQLALLSPSNLSRDAVANRFHDFTTSSSGVLADVTTGGMKRDLSIPFELPSQRPPQGASSGGGWPYELSQSDDSAESHADYHSIWEFSNSGDTNSTYTLTGNWGSFRPDWWGAKMGYVFGYPKGGVDSDDKGNKQYLRGPSWLQLRNYYRLYKRELEARPTIETRGITASNDAWLMRSYQPFSGWHDSNGHTVLSRAYVGDSPNLGTYLRAPSLWDPYFTWEGAPSVNTMSTTTAGLAPVFTKITLVLSYYIESAYGTKALRIACDGVGTIWNPYSVPIETEAVFTAVKLSGLRWRFERTKNGTTTSVSFDQTEPVGHAGEVDFPFEHFRVGVCKPNGPGVRSRPTDKIRLMPGEVRTFTLSNPTPQDYDFGARKAPFGSFSTNWRGGSVLKSNSWIIDDVSKFKFSLTPGIDPDTDAILSGLTPGSNLSFQSFMGSFQDYRERPQWPFDASRNGQNFTDMYEIMGVHASNPEDAMGGLDKFETTFSSFVNVGPANKRAFLAVELRRQATDTADVSMANQIDPRSIINHTAALGQGAQKSIPEGWEIDVTPVSDFDLIQVGVGDRSNGFFGSSHTGSGENNIVFFDVPTAPINSIGALQSAQLGIAGWDAPFTIGSSFAHNKLDQDSLTKEEASTINTIPFTNVYHDRAYLTNYGLWDRYFMSGFQLPEGTTTSTALTELENQAKQFLDNNEPNPLSNRRLKLSSDAKKGISNDKLVTRLTHYRWLARNLMLDGSFNINSTRVEAWKAWLSSLNNAELEKLDPKSGNYSSTTPSDVPFPRHAIVSGDENEAWHGYSSLSTTQIENLAQHIVEEVKLRGPFLSVSDFVNRRLSNDETGEMGALQAALEKSKMNTGDGSEKGIPGTIRQGDLLASLGSSITARSDTFTVRAYGEATNAKGKTTARAWCEAVIQRLPAPVGQQDSDKLLDMPNPEYPNNDPAGLEPYIKNTAISEPTKTFGRRLQVISFRWLAKDEV